MVKITVLYQISGYKTPELVVKSEPISISDHFDPTSISRSSNPIPAEERTNFRAREQPLSRVPVQNVDEDEEERHLNVEENDIQDAININMDEIEDVIDVEKIVKE
jgi:hypothetical protein